MRFINIYNVEVEKRFRGVKYCPKLEESLREVGLLHPIVVEDRGDGSFLLLAGGKRYGTMKKMFEKQEDMFIVFEDGYFSYGGIPVIEKKDLTLLLRKQIEFAENDIRTDFTWQERDEAVARIAELIELREGKKATPRDILDEVLDGTQFDRPVEKVSASSKLNQYKEALRRKEFMDDPVVAKAKSASEANKIIEAKLKKEKMERLAEKYSDKPTEHKYINGDCIEECKKLLDETGGNYFDVILSDPIYGIDMHKAHAFVRTKYTEQQKHEYDDSEEVFNDIFCTKSFPELLYLLAADKAHCYLFCDINRFFDYTVFDDNDYPISRPGLKSMMENGGWYVWPRPLIWYKGNQGSLPRPQHGPRYTYETILFAIKGDKETTGVFHDVFDIPKPAGMDHPAGKPPAVYYELLRRSALPGNKVLDFMAGSGQIFPAANKARCTVTGIEIDNQWRRIALPLIHEDLE